MKKNIFIILRVLIGLTLIVLLFNKLNLVSFKSIFVKLQFRYWVLTVMLILWGVHISCVKLSSLLASFRIKIPILQLCRIYMVGAFWNNFLPGTIGGDVVKYTYLRKYSSNNMDVAIAIFTERFTGLLAMLVVALISVLFYRELLDNDLWIWAISALTTLTMAFALFMRWWSPSRTEEADYPAKRWSRLSSLFYKAHLAGSTLGRDNCAMGWATITSFIYVLDVILVSQVISYGLNYHVPFWQMATMVSLIQIITMLPISINGIGVREWAYVYLLGKCGIPTEAATAISLMAYAAVLLVSLIGGLLFILGREKTQTTNPTPGPEQVE